MVDVPDPLARAFESEGLGRTFKRGTYLFHEGDVAAEIFLLQEGTVEISSVSTAGNQRLVTSLNPPRIFGELAVLGEMARTASALAVTEVRVSSLRGEFFMGLVERNPSVAMTLLRTLARHLDSHESHIDDLLFLDLRGRVAKRLLDLAGDDGVTSAITQADLASLCGGSRENVTRILSELQKKGYVEKDGRRYRVLNRERLERLGDG